MSYTGGDIYGNNKGKRCKQCRHLVKWHYPRACLGDKLDGLCGCFGCVCNVSLEELEK